MNTKLNREKRRSDDRVWKNEQIARPSVAFSLHRRKYILIAIGTLFLSIVIGGAAVVLFIPRRWPHVPNPDLYVTSRPKPGDIAGSYKLTRQTVTRASPALGPNGLEIMGEKQCHLVLRADGTFAVTNFPVWSEKRSPDRPYVSEFISTTGRWYVTNLGIVGNGKDLWGITFSDQIGSLELWGKSAPYNLMMTYDDPDAGQFMLLERER